jgi:1,4-alpha-glucan branching enzyme
MRILAMFFHFPPISGGGVVVAVELVNKLVEKGHDVTVLTPDLEWKGEKFNPKINSKISLIRIDTPSRSNLKVAARRCQSNLLKKGIEIGKTEKFDFIFTIFHPFHLVPKAAVACGKKLGIPVIVKVDDAIYEKSSGIKSIQRKIEKILNSRTLKSASKVLVMNEQTNKIVCEFYGVPMENVSIVPNGVELSIFQKKLPRNNRKIVFSGAMYHHRGLDILLDAASKVKKEVSDVKFILLGSGPELENLQQTAKEQNLQENIEFRGWVPRDEIPSHISDAIVGIGPLRLTTVTSGALPIKVLEYMASSLPVIAKKGTLPNDVVKDEKNGFLIDDSDELAEKIILLLNNPTQVEEMGTKSRNMVQKFSWENVVDSILEIYKKI